MENVQLSITKIIILLPFCFFPLITQSKPIDQEIILYTPYMSRSVTPGKTLTYNIEVINQTHRIQDVTFSLQKIPHSWDPRLAASANTIQQIAVKPKNIDSKNASEDVNLSLNIPLKIKKGAYHFDLIAHTGSGREYILPLKVHITEQGTFKTELQVDQANMEGYANSTFNYNITLRNQTAKEQTYALTADGPPGWDIRFKVNGKYVTSSTLASNKSKKIYVSVKTPEKVKADTYKINVQATSGSASGKSTLEAVVKGKYNLNLATPSGRLSTEVTAGSNKHVKLQLKNTGTLTLRDIKLSASSPADWNVVFNNKQINRLNPGESTTVDATIQASSKAIAGDYQLHITADTPDASAKAAFRITVSKSVTWGSVGILVIVMVLGGIGYLFKKYGRR